MNHILVFKMDNKRKEAKYECILNDKITVRKHYIKVIDEKPQLSVQLDKSKLNELNIKIQMNVKKQNNFDSVEDCNFNTLTHLTKNPINKCIEIDIFGQNNKEATDILCVPVASLLNYCIFFIQYYSN